MERLIVKNFGPIKELDIEVRKFTVLIGEQASGKSTVAKLLAVLRDAFTVLSAKKHEELDEEFRKASLHSYIQRETSISYELSGLYSIQLKSELKEPGGFLNLVWEVAINDEIRKSAELLREKQAGYLALELGYDPQGAEINRILRENPALFSPILRDQIYIPAERSFLSLFHEYPSSFLNQSIPGFLSQFIRRFERARNSIKIIAIPFLGISYKHERGRNLIVDQNGIEHFLNDSASGYQSVVPFFLVIEHRSKLEEKAAYIVEEPELNLFPSIQKQVVSHLVSKVGMVEEGLDSDIRYAFGHQLLITTHSPYVLTTFNNLLYAHRQSLKFPDHAPDIAKIVPAELQISADQFAAYYLSGGTAKSILDAETGLISAEDLDSISDEIEDEFHQLLEFNFERKP